MLIAQKLDVFVGFEYRSGLVVFLYGYLLNVLMQVVVEFPAKHVGGVNHKIETKCFMRHGLLVCRG